MTRTALLALGALLVALYIAAYLQDPARPGGPTVQGWWGWYDQSKFLASAQALARGDLDPWQHLYPLGYPLLVAPFLPWLPRDAAFALVDCTALLAAFAGFVAAARRLGITPLVGGALFVLPLLLTPAFLRQWVLPWNTSPVAALAWWLFACTAAWLDGSRRPVAIGALAAALVACRPSEVVIVLPCLAAIALSGLRERRFGDLMRLIGAGLAVIGPVVALHLAIYGARGTNYFASSAQIGFTLHDFGWKCYVILVDPNAWFGDGEGLIQRVPWVALALPGAAAAAMSGPKGRILAAMLSLHAVLYISYVDLLPGGLWRFSNIHYWAWAIPGYALLAAMLLRDLLGSTRRRVVAASCVAAALPLLCLRCEPNDAGPDQAAKAVDFVAPVPGYFETYFAALSVRDAAGRQENPNEVRAVLSADGVRLFGLKRDFVGPVGWVPGHAPPGLDGVLASRRWTTSLRFGWPAWLRPAAPPVVPIPSG